MVICYAYVNRGLVGHLDQQGNKVSPVFLVLEDSKVVLEKLVKKETKETRVLREHKEQQEMLAERFTRCLLF